MEARGKQVIRGRMRSYCGLIFSLFLLPLQISLSLIITTEGCLQTGRLLVICLLSETKHVPSFSRKRPPRSASFFSKPFSLLSLSLSLFFGHCYYWDKATKFLHIHRVDDARAPTLFSGSLLFEIEGQRDLEPVEPLNGPCIVYKIVYKIRLHKANITFIKKTSWTNKFHPPEISSAFEFQWTATGRLENAASRKDLTRLLNVSN